MPETNKKEYYNNCQFKQPITASERITTKNNKIEIVKVYRVENSNREAKENGTTPIV